MAMGLLNMIPQLPSFTNAGMNFAIGNMNRQRYASQVRHLRRREYQDMVFSMKQAGLNPMLATGATPGHSAGMMVQQGPGSGSAGIGSAIAANRQAKTGEREVRIGEVKAPYEVGNMMMNRFSMAQGIEQTAAQTAKLKADTKLSLEESGTAAMRRLLLENQARTEGVSAKKLNAEIDLINKGYTVTPWNRIGGDAAWLGDKIGQAANSAFDWLSSKPNSDAAKGTK